MASKKTTKGKAPKTHGPATIRGDRIRLVRQERGLTLMKLAAMVDSDPPRISRLELGKGDVRGATILAIANALDVSIDYLFGISEDPNRR